jgi:predicted ester cyclase
MSSTATEARAAADATVIRRYYEYFNTRCFAEAAALFADDAVLEQMPFQRRQQGGAAYLQFAHMWTRAFPDAVIAIERIQRTSAVYEISVLASGTHRGDLDLGGSVVFKATGFEASFQLRELLEIRDGRIAFSCLSFDFQDIVHQLVSVDESLLLEHLARVRACEQQLRSGAADGSRRRELLDRLGLELDAARRVVRPYFSR